MLRGISALPAISAPVDRLRQELQQNNVPAGQESQYFQSKGRPLDPTLLALIKMNQMERASQPRQQPVMGTVLQDKIQAAMQQAQPQPLPPPAVQQQMAARQAQMQQGQGQQGGIAPLPFQSQGYARGGIVAFAGEDDQNDPDSGQMIGGDGVMDEEASDYIPSAAKDQDAADELAASQKLFGMSPSQYFMKYAQSITPESLENKQLVELETKEAERRAKAADKRLGGMSKSQALNYGIAEAAFGALGKRNPWETLSALGAGAIKNKREVESLYRDAEEKKAEAAYNLQHATLLRKAGLTTEATKRQMDAYKLAQAAEKNEIAAKRAAQPKAPTGSAAAQFLARRQGLVDKLDDLDPKSDEYKKIEKKIAGMDAYKKANPDMFAPSVVSAGIGAASRERTAAASNAARIEVAHIMTDFKNSKMTQDQALKAIEEQRKIKTDRLYGGMLANATQEQRDQLMSELELLDQASAAIRQGQPAQSAPPPAFTQPPPLLARPAPTAAPTARPPLSNFAR